MEETINERINILEKLVQGLINKVVLLEVRINESDNKEFKIGLLNK